jgi:hypothetical protein
MQITGGQGELDGISQLMLANEITNMSVQSSFLSGSTAKGKKVVSKERYTMQNLLQHVFIIGGTLRSSSMLAATFMMMLGMLSLSITTAQICVIPVLGKDRYGLTAASLPSGLVFFAGGWNGTCVGVVAVALFFFPNLLPFCDDDRIALPLSLPSDDTASMWS